MCWVITIVNVGGFRAAYGTSYSGGWDSNGYVRDGSILLLVGIHDGGDGAFGQGAALALLRDAGDLQYSVAVSLAADGAARAHPSSTSW